MTSSHWTLFVELHYVMDSKVAYLAANVDRHGVWELEGVKKCVGNDGRPAIRAPHLHEFGEHFGTQDAAVLVRKLDGAHRPCVAGLAGLHPHIEFT